MEKFIFEKKYQEKAFLEHEYVTLGRNTKDIAKQLHVSYKLIEIWLEKFAIPLRNDFIS